MSILFPSTADDPSQIVAQARRLADDIERMTHGAEFSLATLSGAPVLDAWRPALRSVHALVGAVAGHPGIIDGHTAITSELFAIDVEAGWARTWSRFYALKRPFVLADGRLQ
jgi:hypothetical protein